MSAVPPKAEIDLEHQCSHTRIEGITRSVTQLSQKTDQSDNNGRNADGDAECRPGVNPDSTGTDYSERNKISGGGVAHALNSPRLIEADSAF